MEGEEEEVKLDFSTGVDVDFKEDDTLGFPDLSNTNFENTGAPLGPNTDGEEDSFVDDDQASLIDNVPDHSFWSLEYYRVFFNVSAKTVRSRLLKSLMPIRGSFYSKTEVPDLYGPFWIVTTLIVLLAITGNFASYIHFLPSDKHVEWKYDFEKVTVAASVFYTMITVIPLCVWLALKKVGVTSSVPWLAHIISVYGYSFTIYIPATLVCVTPIELARWVTMLVTFVVSTVFVSRNIWAYMPTNNLDWSSTAKAQGSILMIVMALLHAGVAFATKIYFFHYTNEGIAIPGPTPNAVAPPTGTAP
mmetsp:Transcript_20453/g.40493  ORF Transcript_20453/g.40493 Transcript_20453/m.40493 type:complete len:304 (+) Transcript_20453:18-929(+)